MKLKTTRFLSVFMAVFLLFLLCVPVFASSGSTYNQKTSFWDWVTHNPVSEWTGLSDLLGYSFGAYCPTSDDGYHHANSYQADKQNGYYDCICFYCGHHFEAYESDLQQSYNDYIGTLPATIYDSTGALSWKIIPYAGYSYGANVLRYSDYVFLNSTGGSSLSVQFILNEDFVAPIDGIYDLSVVTLDEKYLSITLDSNLHNFRRMLVAGQTVAHKGNDAAGTGSRLLFDAYGSAKSSYWYGYAVISCTPASLGNSYTTTTRPTGITGGNYGIVGDNGQITTVVDNSTIINETNNTYYNPATGQKEKITSWTYDYSDRSYHITLESGDTVTVTYGDQNITINQGGNTYNIYYIIDGGCVDPDPGPSNTPGPSESPDPSDNPDPTDPPHYEHSWKETGRTDPTCTAPGQIKYTCERCGQTQVEVIPATGHTWQVKQTVPTTYDDDGNLIQQGYTIYECSVCGEQYKDVTGAGPPSSSGTIDDGGLTGWLNSLIKYLSDNLSGAVELILSFFRRIPELFGGFLNFLSAMFPYLPDDIIFLLTFGIAAVVFIGIIKAIRR